MARGYTYDTGALISAERNDEAMWALHKAALRAGHMPTIPSAVLAQAWRGGPQHQLSRLLIGCRIESLDEQLARSAGAACAIAGSSDVVDATVAVGASIRGDLVITSDSDDLVALANALNVPLEVQPI